MRKEKSEGVSFQSFNCLEIRFELVTTGIREARIWSSTYNDTTVPKVPEHHRAKSRALLLRRVQS